MASARLGIEIFFSGGGAHSHIYRKKTFRYGSFGHSTPYNAIHPPYTTVNDLAWAIFERAPILVLESQL